MNRPKPDPLIYINFISKVKTSLANLTGDLNALESELSHFKNFRPISDEITRITTMMETFPNQLEGLENSGNGILDVIAQGALHNIYKNLMVMSGEAYGMKKELLNRPERLDVQGRFELFTQTAQNLIDLFNKFSRTFYPTQEFRLALFDLRESILRQIERFDKELKSLNIKLKFGVFSKETKFIGDEALFNDIVLALLKNAIDSLSTSLRSDKRIMVEIYDRGLHFKISITDNGPGVADELKGIIMEPYVTNKPHGVGLGLALAKHNLESAFGGHISYGSKNELTTFTITLTKHADPNNLG